MDGTSPTRATHDPDVQVKLDPVNNARFFYNKRTKQSGWHLHEVSALHAKGAEARGAVAAAAHDTAVRDPDVQTKLDPANNARFYCEMLRCTPLPRKLTPLTLPPLPRLRRQQANEKIGLALARGVGTTWRGA